MIKNIKATVTFPISGEVLHVDFSPPPGVTAVVGPNGSGKSFTGSECARWLLFGKAALRGTADDYKTLDGSGEFTIGGADYLIERGVKKEQIVDATGKVLAVGAKAVTAKVEEIFGYGLAVFDVCNASVQKDADSFGKMMPAARKRMIDRVCGLSSNELIEKQCREQHRKFRVESEALTRTLRPAVKVEVPTGYRPSTEIADELNAIRELRASADAITRTMAPAFEPDKPDVPRATGFEVAALEKRQKEYEVNSAERRRLQAILTECMAYDAVGYAEEQLVVAEQRNIARADIERRGPRPTISLGQLGALELEWLNYNFAKRQSDDHATCPKCEHEFRLGGELPSVPAVAESVLQVERTAHSRWAMPELPMPDGPDLTPAQIDHARKARVAKDRHDRAANMLSDMEILSDVSKVLAATRNAAAEWAAYDKGMARVAAQLAINAEAEAKLRELGELPALGAEDELTELLYEAKTYEAAKARYDEDLAVFVERTKEILRADMMAEEFLKGAKALSEARAELKSVLTPLLSSVATSLIYDMSNGELKSVVVDEDMEITVDGRRIETLSGAGVTVANIALRIGLGQVLVKNTFPVFLGDEMDSDADATRREATLAAMRALKSRLSQIILITHRQIEDVDMVLDLTK